MTMDAAVAETHSATVFFTGDRAYKCKKPIDLGFLDHRTRAAREAVCHREVELNRRLAPDVYLGVADVVGPDGQLCDHLVVMRRLPADRRLATLVTAGVPVTTELRHVAHLVASLHARSPRTAEADAAASVEATRARWQANTRTLIELSGRYFDERTVALTHGMACRYLDGRGALFEDRIAQGRAVDGHGDLLCDDVFLLDDGPRILDCIEFDDSLRLGDGLADAAFLAMDLEHLGRPDLGQELLAAYGEHLGDVWPASLAHHQIAYRAQVRAKVTALRAAQGHPEAAADATALLDLALTHLDAGRVRLVVVGGLPGTGKSTVAAAVAARLGGAVLRADEIRKELAGVSGAAGADYQAGIYTPELTAATYGELLHRASVALGLGELVVLDASFTDARWRDEARAIARHRDADLFELRCDAPTAVAEQRIRARAAVGADPSDATPEVAAAMAMAADPWPEAVAILTDGTPEQSFDRAWAVVGAPSWAPRPVG